MFNDPNTAISRKLLNKSQPKAWICDIDFSAKEIEEGIDELQLHSASGPDDFPSILLKRCKTTLAAPLYQLWRGSLDSGIISQFIYASGALFLLLSPGRDLRVFCLFPRLSSRKSLIPVQDKTLY